MNSSFNDELDAPDVGHKPGSRGNVWDVLRQRALSFVVDLVFLASIVCMAVLGTDAAHRAEVLARGCQVKESRFFEGLPVHAQGREVQGFYQGKPFRIRRFDPPYPGDWREYREDPPPEYVEHRPDGTLCVPGSLYGRAADPQLVEFVEAVLRTERGRPR